MVPLILVPTQLGRTICGVWLLGVHNTGDADGQRVITTGTAIAKELRAKLLYLVHEDGFRNALFGLIFGFHFDKFIRLKLKGDDST